KIEGVRTIIPFLLAISQSREFRRGFYDTSFVETHMQNILDNTDDPMEPKRNNEVIAATAAALKDLEMQGE
ncbi:MAG: acetyl-CoA carboxylase biotin carboxylase subunit, partial [Campylobacter sp.]|nr:acetyl-CoA carboxylase biotin carboxylase subunit [Campylobacter sp.]